MYCYRWEPLRELLEKHRDWDGDPYDGLTVEYVDPVNGGPIFKTMTFFAQMLRPGEHTRPIKQTASLLVTPFEGGGGSYARRRQALRAGRTSTRSRFPAGEWYEHVNDRVADRVLFVASDEPALRAFGLHHSATAAPRRRRRVEAES